MTTIAALRAELKTLYDESWAIIARNGGSIDDNLSNEDRARLAENKAAMLEKEPVLDRLRADVDELDRIRKGHDEYGRPAERHVQPTGDPRGPFAAGLGAGVIASEEYRQAKSSGQLLQAGFSLRVPLPPEISLATESKRVGRELKTLLTSNDASGGSFVLPDRLPGYTPLVRGELAFLDILPTQSTTSDLVEWIQQDTRTNAAAPVAEATASTGTSGTKPESGVAFSVVSKPVETIPTILPITTRILADAPMLRSAVEDELLYMVRETLENQCVTGNGTTPNLLGIANVSGIQTLAAGSYSNAADAIFAAAMACRFTGGVPATALVVTPATMQALRLMRENSATGTLGSYLFGPPNMPGPMTVFGLTVVPAQAVQATTGYVMNATATTIALVEREGANISTGWINDDFGRNIVRLLAELRAVLAVRRPKGIVKITGLP